MWLKAKTPIKLAPGHIVRDSDPAFEVDDKTGDELVRINAAEVDHDEQARGAAQTLAAEQARAAAEAQAADAKGSSRAQKK